MKALIITIGVYVVVISTAIFFIGETYRFVKRKLTKEPESKSQHETFRFGG